MDSCIHIYCGDGKGKTSAALGLALRASGYGKRVLITRFLKTDHSGEVEALKHIPEITLTPCDKSFGFFSKMTKEQKAEAKDYYSLLLCSTLDRVRKEDFDLLILDEIMAVCRFGLADQETLMEFLDSRPSKLEVVLTGRDPWKELVERADYVSEIRKIKHPFDKGIRAREGIEY